jgi:DNA polymerase
MSKKAINQNTNYKLELVNLVESNFLFNKKPINRLNDTLIDINEKDDSKQKELNKLRTEIDSIKNCSLKKNL